MSPASQAAAFYNTSSSSSMQQQQQQPRGYHSHLARSIHQEDDQDDDDDDDDDDLAAADDDLLLEPGTHSQQPGANSFPNRSDDIQTFYVRALYDYESNDKILLSFKRGDLIEVLSRLESGWWDGLLRENVRGWFPSNYVEVIPDNVAEEELRLQAIYEDEDHQQQLRQQQQQQQQQLQQQQQQSTSRGYSHSNPPPPTHHTASNSISQQPGRPRAATGLPSSNPTTTTTTTAQSSAGNNNNNLRFPGSSSALTSIAMTPEGSNGSSTRNGGRGGAISNAADIAAPRPSESDFWVPRVTERGEIIYYNTQTGQESYDLPERQEPSDVLSSEGYTTASSRGHSGSVSAGGGGAAAAAQSIKNPAAFYRPEHRSNTFSSSTTGGAGSSMSTSLSSLSAASTTQHHQQQDDQPSWKSAAAAAGYTQHPHSGTSHTPEFSAFSGPMYSAVNSGQIENGFVNKVFGSSVSSANNINATSSAAAAANLNGSSSLSPSSAAAASTWAAALSGATTAAGTGEEGSAHAWKPRLTDDGQIYVVNIETGETRWPPATGAGATHAGSVVNNIGAASASAGAAGAAAGLLSGQLASAGGVGVDGKAGATGAGGAGAGAGAAPGGPASDKLSGPAGTGPTSFADPSHHARSGASAAVGANAAASGPQGTAASSGPINAGSAATMSSGGGKGGAITLANIAEAFNLAAQQEAMANQPDKFAMAAQQAISGNRHGRFGSGTSTPNNGPAGGGGGGSSSTGSGFASRLAGVGSNGIRGLRSALNAVSGGPATPSAVAAATTQAVAARAAAAAATAAAAPPASVVTATGSVQTSADIDEGSTEGYLRDRYERARHTASATGVRSSRAALLEGAAVAKTEDGAPPSMVNDEAQAVALQRRMEPAPMESMEFLREQALEMIDQLAIAVLPHEYAAHQRSAFFNSLFGPDGELSAAGTDAHIHWLLGHLVHAIRELLLASGALEPTSVDLITLADLSSVSGAGLVPGRLAIAAAQPASTTADANKGGAAAAAAAAIGSAGGSGLTPTGGVRPGASISGAVGAASHTSDIPSSLADAMFTLHNANKAAVTSAMPMSRNVRDIVALTASQVATGSPPPDLREASKKACSTLSRVVFSARAISEELSHVQSSLRAGSSTSLAGAGRRSGSVSSGAPSGQQPDQAQLRAERENALRQRVREQAIELAQTVAFITEECERARANGVSGTESWVRRVQPVLRSGIGTAGIGMDIFSGGMAAGWRGSGFSLPSALDTAALRAEAMGNYNNPFDLTKDAQIALASGKLAMRRRPAHQLTASLWKDKIEPHVQDLKVRLQAFNASLEEADRAASVSSSLSVLEEQQQQQEQTSASSKALDALFASAKETLARLGTVQTLVEDLDLASSLDVDSCSETVNADAAAKGSARRARECLTHFLWNKQDLQDLGCTLMMDLQDRVPTQTLQQTSGAVLASVESMADTIGELVVLVEKQSQGSNTHIGSRARVYGAKDLAPPPTASQVMAAPALGNQGGIKTEIAPIGMGIVGSGLGAASLLDENQINDGAGNAPTAGGAAGAGAAAAAAAAQEEDAGVMYLGPGIAVPDGPTGPARNRADSAARGASPALSGTTMGTNNGRNRAGSVTNRSVGTASSVHERAQGSVLTLVGTPSGNAGSSGGNNGAGGDEDSDHTSGVGVSAGGKAGSKSKDGSSGGGGGGAASNGLSGGIPPIVEEAPWFLEPDYAPGDIVMTPEGQVKGATLAALMERLTTHQGFDSAFNTTFLMTYRSFTTTGEFLERVFARYRISPPVGLTPDEHAVWVEKKQRPIQTRVFNVLKLWLEQHFYDGDDDEHIPAIKEFARTEAAKAQASDAQVIHVSGTALLRVLDRRVGASEQAIRTLVHASSAPAPIMPKNAKKVKLLEIDPLEFARQLTIIESAKYREIKPAECLGKAWTAPNAEVNAKGIKSMIALSNNLTGWVMESILAQTELKRRSLFIKHFILIAERCRSLNNYSTMTAIISALNSAPIHRMKRTWDAVNQRTVGVLDGLMRTMSSTKNFAFYRDLLHKLNPPCVPFLGVWLTDLTFIEDGNPDRLKTDNRLINFNKRQKTADIIREIMIYQSTQYNLTPVPLLQTFLADALAPKDDRTQDAMFEQSEKLEPKEREDERIARLLQESGFL